MYSRQCSLPKLKCNLIGEASRTYQFLSHASDAEETYILDRAMDGSISDLAQQDCQVDDSNMSPGDSHLSPVPIRVQSQPELMPSRASFKKRIRGEDTAIDLFLNVSQTVRTFPLFLQAQVKSSRIAYV
jgi:hypothetical protein